MTATLHITNGDMAEAGIRVADGTGRILPWRDVLHEGPVPPGLSLSELSRVRAAFIGDAGMGESSEIEKSFRDRDDTLRRFCDYDEVVLWFEWDLYDQLQLIQVLDFLADSTAEELSETGTRVSLICIPGYLGKLDVDEFPPLHAARKDITPQQLALGRRAWSAFRSGDPREVEAVAAEGSSILEYLPGALTRELEELPSTHNGLSRSESQILEAVAQRSITFSEIFKRTASREERIFCGDATLASYIERLSDHRHSLLSYPTGESIDAPRTAEDSAAFRNAQIALTKEGRQVLAGESDWIALGGTDRWLGGLHLDGSRVRWRWDTDNQCVVDTAASSL